MRFKTLYISICSLLWMEASMAMTLTSADFAAQGNIPQQYTCTGKDLPPNLAWSQAPAHTESFVLIMDDPDAPAGNWTHWVVYNIPKATQQLKSGEPLPVGTLEGENSWNTYGYRGPCPPTGAHRYVFTLYALDTTLKLSDGAKLSEVLAAMKNHILGTVDLIGKYQKP